MSEPTTYPIKTNNNRSSSTSTRILRLPESEYWTKMFENQEDEEWSEDQYLPTSEDQIKIAGFQAPPNTITGNVSCIDEANTENQPHEIKVSKSVPESQANKGLQISIDRKLSNGTVGSETLSNGSYFQEFEKVDSSPRPTSKGYNSGVKRNSVIRESTMKPWLDESIMVQEGYGGFTNFKELDDFRKFRTQSGIQPWPQRVIKVVEEAQAPGRITITVSKSGSWSSSSSSMGYKRLASNQMIPRKSGTEIDNQNYRVEEFPKTRIIDTCRISSPYEMSDDSEISELLGVHSEKPSIGQIRRRIFGP